MEPDGGIPLSLVLADVARPCSSEGYRRLAYMMLDGDVVAVSPSSVYRVVKSAGKLAVRWGKPSKKGSVRLARQKYQETQRQAKAWQDRTSNSLRMNRHLAGWHRRSLPAAASGVGDRSAQKSPGAYTGPAT